MIPIDQDETNFPTRKRSASDDESCEIKIRVKGIKIESQNEEEASEPEFPQEIIFEFGDLPPRKRRKRCKGQKPKKQSMKYTRSRFVGVVGFQRKGKKSDNGIVWYAQRNGKYERCESELAAALRSDEMARDLQLRKPRLNFPQMPPTSIK